MKLKYCVWKRLEKIKQGYKDCVKIKHFTVNDNSADNQKKVKYCTLNSENDEILTFMSFWLSVMDNKIVQHDFLS